MLKTHRTVRLKFPNTTKHPVAQGLFFVWLGVAGVGAICGLTSELCYVLFGWRLFGGHLLG